MNPPSTRICKRRTPLRRLPDPHQTPPVSRRRSSRIDSRERSVSIPLILGSYYEPQPPLDERSTDPRTSQPTGATSYTRVPTSGLVKASVPSSEQFQEYLSPQQINNSQSRKRGPDRSIEAGAERPFKRARLTKENLKEFEKMGGQGRKPGKEPKSTSRKSSRSEAKTRSSATTESSSKTVSTTDSTFPRLVFENGILDPLNSAPPENLGCLQDRLNRARDTESPTESEYEDFVYRTQAAPNEQTMLLETSKSLLKGYKRGYRRVYNQALSDFPKSVGFNAGLSAPQPDMIEGLDLREFDPFPVRQDLGGAAVPTLENNATTLPQLAGEWKAAGKDMIQARTQAAYDGACMVYGRNVARSFLGSPDAASHAYIQTFTTDGTTLNTFAHYSTKSQDQVKYHQYPTSSSFLTSSYEDFKKSRRRLRNLQDDAKETSEKLRDELNEKWSTNQRPAVAPSVPAEIADPTDYNSYDYDDDEDPNAQLLAEYTTSFTTSDQYDSVGQIPATDNVYAPPFGHGESLVPISAPPYTILGASDEDATPFPFVTPPQSSEDRSLPRESSEDNDQSNVRGYRRTRRTRPPVVVDA